jgi:hypothetical protein
VIVRTLVLLLAAALLCSCTITTSPETSARVEALKTGVKESSQAAATATVRGAEAVGEAAGTAYRGVTNGFETPESQAAFGPYPQDYVSAIRKHMMRFEGVKESASLVFGKPARGYLNKGLLRGGEIDWQGWVVDLTIETRTLLGQPDVDQYVVRMKDGEVVEVLEKAHAGAIRRIDDATAPVPAAPRQ